MPKKALERHVAEWRVLAEAVARNLGDLEHLRITLETLNTSLDRILEARQRQLALRAAAQQATRDLEAAMDDATVAAVSLNQGVVGTYGNRTEKLREFGLRPRKGPGPRKKAPAAAQEEPASPRKLRRPRR